MSYIKCVVIKSIGCLLMGLVLLMASGCGTTPPRPMVINPDSASATPDVRPKPHTAKPQIKAEKGPNLEQRLRKEVRQWQGTPHRMGGDSHRGIDCSGFVHQLYRGILGRKIPRSTALLVKSGHPIDRSQLRTGDLVFFHTPNKGRHVGIYLGRSDFAHASASKGVMISSLEEPFWRRHYWTARRYQNAPKG